MRLSVALMLAALGSHLATDLSSLVFGGSTPNATVLVGLDCEVEAFLLHGALATHVLGFADLQQRLAGRADGEEQLWVGVPAESLLAPFVVGGSKSKAGGKYRHDNPPIDDGG